MNEQGLRWDDLRIITAISETGSLSGAARRLGISHATVFRRLKNLEDQWGVTLFERSRTGYVASAAGEEVAGVAKQVDADIHAIERRLAGQDFKLSGSIRITTTDTLFTGLLAPIFENFQAEYPEITLEVVISNQILSLSKREADIAIRPSRTPPETLLGRKAGAIQQAVYGCKNQWRNQTLEEDSLDHHRWIGPDIHMGDKALESWMTQKGLDGYCYYRVDSMLGMQAAVRQGSGLAVLPCYLGDSDDELQRLSAPLPELSVPLWILMHPDLKRVNRARTFTAFVYDEIRQVIYGASD